MHRDVAELLDRLDLKEGSVWRGDCPVCGGRHTFSAHVINGTTLYNCFKASCDVSGMHGRMITPEALQRLMGVFQEPQKPKTSRLVLPTYVGDVQTDCGHEFLDKWCLGLIAHELMEDPMEGRILFPVRDNVGRLVDAVGRSVTNGSPKWLRYGNSGLPYVQQTGDINIAIVVEDAISAAVVGIETEMAGVALMGTHLTAEHKEHLKQYDEVHVMLDPDATLKSIQIVKELRGYVDVARGHMIEDDLKYQRRRDMELLHDIQDSFCKQGGA